MSPKNQFRYKKNLKPLYTPSHEVMAGIILGTRIFAITGEVKQFADFDEANSYRKKHREFKWQTPCIIESKQTTLGRYKFSQLFNGDIDEYLGDRENITSKDIPYLYTHIEDLDDRLERIQQIQEFALLIVTMSGMTVPKLSEMHADLPMEFLDQIRAVEKDDRLTQKEKDVKVRIIYDDFLKSINEVDENGKYIRVPNELVMKVSDSSRAKPNQLMSMMVPLLNVDPQGAVTVGVSSLVEGMTPTDYLNMAIENRVTQDIKVSSVPRSGYTTRQLEYLGTPYVYSDKEEGKANTGIILDTKSALGRTRVDGTVVTESDVAKASKDDIVKVRSVITSKSIYDGIVCRDSVSNINRWKDGASIGISLLTSLTEGVTQGSLSLKHGGHLFEVEKNSTIYAPDDVTLEVDEDWIILRSTKSKKTYVYPKSLDFVRNYTSNNIYKKGEIVGIGYRLVTPSYRLDSIIKLIGASGTSSQKKILNNKVLITECYSFDNGTIHYTKGIDGKCSGITIGKFNYQYNPNALYFFPEGAEVKKGVRFCTGMLSVDNMIHKVRDYTEGFYYFRKQFNELLSDITPELIELVYTLIIEKGSKGYYFKSVYQSIKQGSGSLNRLAFRDARSFFTPITEEGIEFVADPISDIFLPSLFMYNI